MTRKTIRKKRNRKRVGVAALVEPGYGALYIRTPWIQKLNKIGQRKPKRIRKLRRRLK